MKTVYVHKSLEKYTTFVLRDHKICVPPRGKYRETLRQALIGLFRHEVCPSKDFKLNLKMTT